MRGSALLLVLVVACVAGVGCVERPEWVDHPPPGEPGGFGGSGSGSAGTGNPAFCVGPSDCMANQSCTRNDQCWNTDQIRTVHATWTLSGMAADPTSCASHPDLYITFRASAGFDNIPFSFAPVPCVEGEFSLDRLPPTYDRVDLGTDNRDGSLFEGTVDTTGVAQIDLPL